MLGVEPPSDRPHHSRRSHRSRRGGSALRLPSRQPSRLPTLPASARVLEIELSEPLPIITAFDKDTQVHYKRVLCLIRFHTQPLGILQFPFQSDELLPEGYAPSIWHTFKHALLRHLEQDGLSAIEGIGAEGLPYHDLPRCIAERERFLVDAPFVSVIVPTRDRPESLAMCIDALLKLHYPRYEIIIVDNAPTTQKTAHLVQETYGHVSNLRYVREDGQGASYARNRGIQEARGEILAFTDDDVVVDIYWLAQCVRAFDQSSEVVCVTGYTLPLELDTPAQLWFEDVSWVEDGEVHNKFLPRLFDKKTRYRQLYRGSLCGHSANMAAKADFLRRIGGFDIVLGAGTPAMGGEDLALFLHVIMHNKILAYEPTAVVHHHHRRDYDKLRQQVFGYGVGFTAYLIHVLLRYPVLWVDLLTKTPYDILCTLLARKSQSTRVAGRKRSAARLKGASKSTHYPGELVAIQLKGFFYGPLAYIKSRRAFRM
jgi:glycosyltransferase involved in cell wall biosynthesis